VGLAAIAFCLAPGTASADVLFDPADADELAATLDEAYREQNVCYGWSVTIDNVGVTDVSVGSNFGAGVSLDDQNEASCDQSVEFIGRIAWTSESSEAEDFGSYSVVTSPGGKPDTADLNSLELISVDGLIGDNGDVEVYKAVSALPLLAADAGIAPAIEATPAPEGSAGADAQPTNSPGSDFWRNNGMMILWGSVILLAGGVFAWWVIRTDKRRYIYRGSRGTGPVRAAPVGPPEEQIPAYVPEDWATATTEPADKPADPGPPAEADPPAEPGTPVESGKAAESGKPAEDPESPPEPTPGDDPAEPDRTGGDTENDPPEASSPDEPPRPKS
jgi:hypothetical protein